MALRIPSAPEAEHLADYLEACGYPPAEAAANFRNAFPAWEAWAVGFEAAVSEPA
jgi:hypothetical protein